MYTYNKLVNLFYQNIALPPNYRPNAIQFALILITPITTLLIIILFASNVPNYDQWRFIPLLNQLYENNINFESLWAQHNEHRILFPRILMLLLASISGWSIYVEIGTIWLMAILIFILLCHTARRQFGKVDAYGRTSHPYKIYICFSILIFSMIQSQNWLWGWQITIFMSVLATIIGYYVLTFTPFRQTISLIISIVCGIIAMLSFANGLLYWPIGLLVLLVNKNRWPVVSIIGWLIVSILSYIVYFIDYHQVGHHPSLLYGFQHPIKLICYYIIFVGSPICQTGRYIGLNFIVGSFGLITVIYLINLFLKERYLFNTSFLFWHSLLLYVLLTAAITALGRSGFGLDQALAGRYVTITNLFWIWIIVMGYATPQREHKYFAKFIPLLFFIATVLVGLSGAKNVAICKLDQQKLALHEQQLRKGNLNTATLEAIYKEAPNLVATDNKILKRYKLAFYE